MFSVLTLVISTLTFAAAVFSQEPSGDGECSRFVYEYKILQKLIQVEAENAKQLQRIEQLERLTKKPTVVSTHVGLSKTTTVTGTAKVKYDVVVANIGGGYDLTESVFTTPVSGLYLIHVQACLRSGGQWIDLNIMKDGAVIGRVFTGDSTYHTSSSELLNVNLKQGDRVWVRREAGTATSLNQDHGWNSFKAILLAED